MAWPTESPLCMMTLSILQRLTKGQRLTPCSCRLHGADLDTWIAHTFPCEMSRRDSGELGGLCSLEERRAPRVARRKLCFSNCKSSMASMLCLQAGNLQSFTLVSSLSVGSKKTEPKQYIVLQVPDIVLLFAAATKLSSRVALYLPRPCEGWILLNIE